MSINLNTLKKGQLVKISNGEKEPAKHHTKKHAAWEQYNRQGYVYEYEAEYHKLSLGTNPQCQGIVMAISATKLTVELI